MGNNLPASAGDIGSIPDPGRSHMPRGSSACEPQLLGLCSRAWEPQLLKPARPGAGAAQETPLRWEARAMQLESSSRRLQLDNACTASKTEHSQK